MKFNAAGGDDTSVKKSFIIDAECGTNSILTFDLLCIFVLITAWKGNACFAYLKAQAEEQKSVLGRQRDEKKEEDYMLFGLCNEIFVIYSERL